MKINEVIKETGLTKKAVYFYEDEGLIKPKKDEENNYRIYSKEDVNSLNLIYSLRKLDFSIKEILRILAGHENIADGIQSKLSFIDNEIERLQKNKQILEQLDLKEHVDTDELKQLAMQLEKESRYYAGFMQKELERILPGNVGKMFAIHYGQFLNEPLNTEEKEKAWHGLIQYLDDQEEMQYPEDIQKIVDEMYGKYSEEQWVGLGEKAKNVTDSVLNRTRVLNKQEKADLEREMQEYYKTDEYQRFLKLQKYLLENMAPLFREVDQYVCVLSSRYGKFNELMRNVAQPE
ncbi:MAG: MerR family transcriptional regulator [Eubacteriales bacterium]